MDNNETRELIQHGLNILMLYAQDCYDNGLEIKSELVIDISDLIMNYSMDIHGYEEESEKEGA